MSARPWWQGAAIYQIYLRSFADTDGDGVGDLPGVTAHLDYVSRLGVDAIWLSPFYPSPQADFGYDVADYCDVDPLFGTLADFDALVARARALGLRVIVDQPWSHTSDQHPWFAASRAAREGPHADWYVWADARRDGSPPNNWQSVFGGPAWTWDARRRQYYLHNFLSAQPQLNAHHPTVQEHLLDIARFWLGRGVDGFRLDAINFLMHDPMLRDNPPAPDDGRPRLRPFDFQLHAFNQSHAAIPAFLERLRALTDARPGRFTLAEVGGADAVREMRLFTAAGRLDSAYGFDFLYADALTPAVVAVALAAWPAGQGWPSWAFENHDAPRAGSRWATAGHHASFARMKLLLLACLRGNPIVYYGEELGLTQVDVPFEQLRDPEAIANWPRTLARDGARTPMPWRADAPAMGFSAGTPWLPLGCDHAALAVDRQEADTGSLLAWTRKVLALRRAHPALHHGDAELVAAEGDLLVFDRHVPPDEGGERLRCVFNLSARPLAWAAPGGWTSLIDTVDNGGTGLPPYGARVLRAAA